MTEFLAFIERIQQNWSWLELSWSLMAVLGIILSSRALGRVTVLVLSATQDGMAWPTRRRLVKRIRDAAGAFARHIGFLLIGLVAMALPPSPVRSENDYVPGMVIALVLIAVVVWDIISLQWDEWDWASIVKALIHDPNLWQRVIHDEERVQQKVAQQLGQELPHQAHHSSEGRCS